MSDASGSIFLFFGEARKIVTGLLLLLRASSLRGSAASSIFLLSEKFVRTNDLQRFYCKPCGAVDNTNLYPFLQARKVVAVLPELCIERAGGLSV